MSLGSVLFKCRSYDLVRFRHQKHFVWEKNWKLSPCLLKNLQYFHTYKCWNTFSSCSYQPSLFETPPTSSFTWYDGPGHTNKNIWMWTHTFCRNVAMVRWLRHAHMWMCQRSAETLTANILSVWLDCKSFIVHLITAQVAFCNCCFQMMDELLHPSTSNVTLMSF